MAIDSQQFPDEMYTDWSQSLPKQTDTRDMLMNRNPAFTSDVLSKLIVPFYDQIQGTKDWRSTDTGMEAVMLALTSLLGGPVLKGVTKLGSEAAFKVGAPRIGSSLNSARKGLPSMDDVMNRILGWAGSGGPNISQVADTGRLNIADGVEFAPNPVIDRRILKHIPGDEQLDRLPGLEGNLHNYGSTPSLDDFMTRLAKTDAREFSVYGGIRSPIAYKDRLKASLSEAYNSDLRKIPRIKDDNGVLLPDKSVNDLVNTKASEVLDALKTHLDDIPNTRKAFLDYIKPVEDEYVVGAASYKDGLSSSPPTLKNRLSPTTYEMMRNSPGKFTPEESDRVVSELLSGSHTRDVMSAYLKKPLLDTLGKHRQDLGRVYVGGSTAVGPSELENSVERVFPHDLDLKFYLSKHGKENAIDKRDITDTLYKKLYDRLSETGELKRLGMSPINSEPTYMQNALASREAPFFDVHQLDPYSKDTFDNLGTRVQRARYKLKPEDIPWVRILGLGPIFGLATTGEEDGNQ